MTTTYLWNPPPVYSLPVRGKTERLPVNRIFLVGRNYHAHAVEMGPPVELAALGRDLDRAVPTAETFDGYRTKVDRLLGLTNDLGLLAEEYDVKRERQVGNFPQAFSHLTLIGAARAISAAQTGAERASPASDGAP